MKQIIAQKLSQLKPHKLEIIDETSNHAGHLDKNTAETHFKILIISDCFENYSIIERHRIIYDIFKEEIPHKIHALSMKLLTLKEVEKSDKLQPKFK